MFDILNTQHQACTLYKFTAKTVYISCFSGTYISPSDHTVQPQGNGVWNGGGFPDNHGFVETSPVILVSDTRHSGEYLLRCGV